MATATSTETQTWHSVADLIERLGGIPAERIRMNPPPGTATEDDLIQANARKEGALCELVDGVLVEKPVAVLESRLAAVLIKLIGVYLETNRIGMVFAPDAMFRMKTADRVREPDVAFVRAEEIPGGKLERIPIASFPFDLAVEILSVGNTPREMEMKRAEYFGNGTRLMWVVDPATRRVRVYNSVEQFTEYGEEDQLSGGDVLPGFTLSIREWFRDAETV